VENIFIILQQFIQETMYQILSESPYFLQNIQKTCWYLFGHAVLLFYSQRGARSQYSNVMLNTAEITVSRFVM